VFNIHGSADEVAFEVALNRAYDASKNQLLERVRERIAHAAPLLMGVQAERAEPASTPL
jgi:glycerol-3-phosphate acyltransferase PlsX